MTNVLFLCTGNTCRSPMAACLFNAYCQKRGLPLAAVSAGLYAQEGAAASLSAQAAMQAQGLSLAHHRAQPLTLALAKEADLIMAMSPQHATLCQERFPNLSTPMRCFAPAIPDPFGGSPQAYLDTAACMDPQIKALADLLASAL